ncbi:SDR family NAD(P)-dependent oxidoreductase [Streptomyces sp. MCAF7]
MPTIAIVGAGPGLGLSIAKVFGGHGFDVALVSRSKDKLDALVAQLAQAGITAEGFPADVPMAPSSLPHWRARFPGSEGSTSWSSRRTPG